MANERCLYVIPAVSKPRLRRRPAPRRDWHYLSVMAMMFNLDYNQIICGSSSLPWLANPVDYYFLLSYSFLPSFFFWLLMLFLRWL